MESFFGGRSHDPSRTSNSRFAPGASDVRRQRRRRHSRRRRRRRRPRRAASFRIFTTSRRRRAPAWATMGFTGGSCHRAVTNRYRRSTRQRSRGHHRTTASRSRREWTRHHPSGPTQPRRAQKSRTCLGMTVASARTAWTSGGLHGLLHAARRLQLQHGPEPDDDARRVARAVRCLHDEGDGDSRAGADTGADPDAGAMRRPKLHRHDQRERPGDLDDRGLCDPGEIRQAGQLPDTDSGLRPLSVAASCRAAGTSHWWADAMSPLARPDDGRIRPDPAALPGHRYLRPDRHERGVFASNALSNAARTAARSRSSIRPWPRSRPRRWTRPAGSASHPGDVQVSFRNPNNTNDPLNCARRHRSGAWPS